jgi:hypothetical protein
MPTIQRLTEWSSHHAYAIRRGRWRELAAPGVCYSEWVNSLDETEAAGIVAAHCGTAGYPRVTALLTDRWLTIIRRTHLEGR